LFMPPTALSWQLSEEFRKGGSDARLAFELAMGVPALLEGGFSLITRFGLRNTAAGGRIFYVGEGAEKLAVELASETGYKTIYNTWYGTVGQKITPFLSESTSRKMWAYLSVKFANGAKYGDDIITVFGRHRETGLHTLPINTRAVWKTIEFPILKGKGIPYRPILTP